MSSDFKFRLESILRLRERERDEASSSLQLAWLAIQKIESQIADLHEQHAAEQPLQRASSSDLVNPQLLLDSKRFQMQLMQDISRLNADKKLIEAEREKRRWALIEKEKLVRSLEKLRDRQLAQYQLGETRKEQANLDQWAGFNHWKSVNADKTAVSQVADQVNTPFSPSQES